MDDHNCENYGFRTKYDNNPKSFFLILQITKCIKRAPDIIFIKIRSIIWNPFFIVLCGIIW